jgi:hypothetical protein
MHKPKEASAIFLLAGLKDTVHDGRGGFECHQSGVRAEEEACGGRQNSHAKLYDTREHTEALENAPSVGGILMPTIQMQVAQIDCLHYGLLHNIQTCAQKRQSTRLTVEIRSSSITSPTSPTISPRGSQTKGRHSLGWSSRSLSKSQCSQSSATMNHNTSRARSLIGLPAASSWMNACTLA